MNNSERLYMLKTTIFIILYLGSIKSVYDDYLLIIKNKGIIFPSDYYKDNEEKKYSLKKARKFFLNCVEDKLINQKNFIKNDDPLVSVVIPVYNAEFKIKKAIRSIQNQNTSNLEIILVNDLSTDNTIDVLKKLQKEDERIIVLENKINMGIFYSRCIGTLKASGKYIFPLDNDDLFFDEGTIDIIVNESIKGKFDIVEFNYAEFFNPKIPPNKFITSEFGNHTHNLILYQPQLGQFPRNKNNVFGVYDCYVWAKCIESELYKKSINKIGIHIYSKYILRGEDYIITFVLFRLAKSFYYFGKYGIFRYKNFETATFKSSRELYLLSRIIYIDIILRFTEKNYEDKKYVVYVCNIFLKILGIEFNKLRNKNKKYAKKVFQKLLKNKYILMDDKKRFISFFKKHSWMLQK